MTAARSRPDTSALSQAQGKLPGGVKVTFLNAGTCRVPEVVVRPGGGFRLVDLPALAALIHHPTEGPVLFDTGYSPRFFAATERLPHRLYRWITPVTCSPQDTVAAQLPALGVTPQAVRQVVISHFDPDHIGGLRDFGAARIVCHAEAWESVRGRRGADALRARVLPGHLPRDLDERVCGVTDFGADSVAPLPGAHDLFGDGTVLLVGLPGHAPGHMGALIRRRAGGLWLLVADALWTRAALDRARPTAHTLIAVDRRAQLATYTLLRQLHRERPDITIVPTHCPEAADELLPKSLHSWRPEQ